jgi:hypothetical protein
MNSIGRAIAALGNGVKLALTIIAVATLLWALVYRFILFFTPLWLDLGRMLRRNNSQFPVR